MSDFPSAPPPMGVAGTPATFAQRFIAVLIDAGIGLAMFIPVLIFALIVGAISDTLGAIVGILLYLLVFLAVMYMILGGIGLTGQTPGKRMQGIKVVNSGGEVIGIGGSVVRYIVQYITNIVCYIGGLWMLFDADKKTLYDKILDNQVIQVEKGGIMPIFPNGNPI
jgi:uncharacterized RDD family membrane protein YckC